MTQTVALVVVLALALGALFMAWFAVAAAMLSSEISASEREADNRSEAVNAD